MDATVIVAAIGFAGIIVQQWRANAVNAEDRKVKSDETVAAIRVVGTTSTEKLKEVHDTFNSKMDAMIEAVKLLAFEKGRQAGIGEANATAAMKKDAITMEVGTQVQNAKKIEDQTQGTG